jgi:hypothetical protein
MDGYSSRALALAYRVAYFIPLYWVSHGKFPLRKCRDSPWFEALDSGIQTYASGKEKRAAWAARFLHSCCLGQG